VQNETNLQDECSLNFFTLHAKRLFNFPSQLGYHVEGKELDDIFWRFKSIAEKKKVTTTASLPLFLVL